MNKKLFNVILFTAGAAIGSLVTWKVVKTKYERMMQEEIDAFKEDYLACMRRSSGRVEVDDETAEEELDEEEDDESDDEESTMTDYYKLASKYKKADKINEEGGGGDDVPYINGPYVISPTDFGDGNYDHDCYCLSYYSDGVLSNDWFEELDVDETIGEDSLAHFGEYAEDILHVRNERLKADYEVVRDYRNYADLLANDPHIHMHAD